MPQINYLNNNIIAVSGGDITGSDVVSVSGTGGDEITGGDVVTVTAGGAPDQFDSVPSVRPAPNGPLDDFGSGDITGSNVVSVIGTGGGSDVVTSTAGGAPDQFDFVPSVRPAPNGPLDDFGSGDITGSDVPDITTDESPDQFDFAQPVLLVPIVSDGPFDDLDWGI